MHTHLRQLSVQLSMQDLSTQETILTMVTSVCLHCRGRVNLSDGILNCVLLQPRMCNGGSGGVFMFVLAPALSTYPALGILKQTCPVPSSVHCSIVFHFPHW